MGIKNILLNTSTSNGPISVDIWKQYFKYVFLPAFVFIAYPNLDHLATSKVPFAKPYFKCLAGDHIAHLNDFLRTRMGIFFTLMMQQGYKLTANILKLFTEQFSSQQLCPGCMSKIHVYCYGFIKPIPASLVNEL